MPLGYAAAAEPIQASDTSRRCAPSSAARAPGSGARPCGASTRRRSTDSSCASSDAVDQHAVDPLERKRRDRAGREPGDRRAPPRARATRRGSAPGCARDLVRVSPAVAGDERDHRTLVAQHDERLDDLATSRPTRVRGLRASRFRPRTPRCAPPRRTARRKAETRSTSDCGKLSTSQYMLAARLKEL